MMAFISDVKYLFETGAIAPLLYCALLISMIFIAITQPKGKQ